MIIRILGSNVTDCDRLAKAAREAVADLTLHATIETVTDPRAITRYGVRSTPALMVDGRLVVSGRVPSAAEIQALLAVAPAS